EGAIIGAGGSPIGLGGDIGGSIRLPAFFNGVVGHKATGGRVPETGCWPGASGLIGRYKVCGPLGRRVEDVKALMPILARPDGRDASVDGPAWGAAPELDPHEVTVYWFDDNGVISPSPDIRAAVRAAATSLAAMGCRVERWRPPGIERSFQIWANALEHAGGPKYIDTLGDFEAVNLLAQWLRWPLGKSDHIFPCLALATLEAVVSKFPAWGRRMADQRLVLQREIETKLGPRGVMLCPVFHRTAPRHGLEAMKEFLGFTYSGGLNPTEIPATAVPMGFGSCGLPTGVQIAAVRNNDHLTLEVAGWLERAHGGWRPGPIRGVDA
ncbi:MAG: amidase, partial [Myxococcales bacterium]|nr:amidase [Myxococcales bacterium]